ncbi:hypothetical protein [Chlorobium phaeovibrioides]|nr:hypothetical protein [Chlorobium phaeovibrioides]
MKTRNFRRDKGYRIFREAVLARAITSLLRKAKRKEFCERECY